MILTVIIHIKFVSIMHVNYQYITTSTEFSQQVLRRCYLKNDENFFWEVLG